MNTHLHITSWVLALILLVVVVLLHKQGKAKGAKITQMIMRLDYLLILYSGGGLLGVYFGGPNVGLAIVKAIAGIWTIAAIEMTAIKTVKDEPANSWWTQLVIALLITLILGFGFL
ncbi:MAG TPA: YisL family protein [Bacillota bacterium]|nr:YisL family protein [Bacillota bacterium]